LQRIDVTTAEKSLKSHTENKEALTSI